MASPSVHPWRVVAVSLLAAGTAVAQPAPSSRTPVDRPLLGDRSDGSRAQPVHVIPLRDADGEIIRPNDSPLVPFSPTRTCAGGECHSVSTITRGWHFRTTDPTRPNGRRGEPWILVDRATATQVPVSYRAESGALDPDQVGLSPWSFAMSFGDRTPGGLGAARERNPGRRVRWAVSGELDVNCLACHDASPAYDHAEYGRQVQLENFRWAPAAASGLAAVTGAAREMPNTFDHLMPRVEDSLMPRVPSIEYGADRFLPGARVVFDIQRQVPERRCYFCHSNADVARTDEGRWNVDEDIHVARGMTCVDCHRNGLDHEMIRGYPGETSASGVDVSAYSCRGCHLAAEPERIFARGRLGAPYPEHTGIPQVHFAKLSCTACHSGPLPESTARALKTSLAHRLGGLGVNKSPGVLPHISYPVFAEQPDGITTPNRAVWPAYWGRLTVEGVEPIAPARVRAAMAKARVSLATPADGDWPALDEDKVTAILKALDATSPSKGGTNGQPVQDPAVYVAGGKLRRLSGSGQLTSEAHAAAQPYVWPIAHDVRPAALSLGARGCNDCHDAGAPIFYGDVAVDSPIAADRQTSWKMSQFQPHLDMAYAGDFARSFRYRSYYKAGATAAAAIFLLFVLAYATPGVRRLSTAAATTRWTRTAITIVALAACAVGAASGWRALVSGEPLVGYALMTHVALAPALLVGAVLITLFWAHANAFSEADWSWLRHPRQSGALEVLRGSVVILRKITFWIAVVALIPATLSATLAMFPVLASVRQDALFWAHRYSVVVLLIAAGASAGLAVVAALLSRTWKQQPEHEPV